MCSAQYAIKKKGIKHVVRWKCTMELLLNSRTWWNTACNALFCAVQCSLCSLFTSVLDWRSESSTVELSRGSRHHLYRLLHFVGCNLVRLGPPVLLDIGVVMIVTFPRQLRLTNWRCQLDNRFCRHRLLLWPPWPQHLLSADSFIDLGVFDSFSINTGLEVTSWQSQLSIIPGGYAKQALALKVTRNVNKGFQFQNSIGLDGASKTLRPLA